MSASETGILFRKYQVFLWKAPVANRFLVPQQVLLRMAVKDLTVAFGSGRPHCLILTKALMVLPFSLATRQTFSTRNIRLWYVSRIHYAHAPVTHPYYYYFSLVHLMRLFLDWLVVALYATFTNTTTHTHGWLRVLSMISKLHF
jgi:hypothetical protein